MFKYLENICILLLLLSNCVFHPVPFFLFRNYNGPQRTSPEHKGSSQRGYSRAPYSPGFEYVDDNHSKYIQDRAKARANYADTDDSEVGYYALIIIITNSPLTENITLYQTQIIFKKFTKGKKSIYHFNYSAPLGYVM